MMGCPWKNRDTWFPDKHDKTKNQKPKKDITNYFTPRKEKTNDKGTKKETKKKETNSSAMVIDNEDDKKIENTGKKDEKEPQSAKNLKESKDSKEPKQTINLKEKPNNSSEQKSKETTGKPDQSAPKSHPLNPIFISRPKRTVQPDSIQGVLKNCRKYTTFIKIRLPKVMSEAPNEQETEVTTAFEKIFKKMISNDASIKLYTWHKNS